MQDELLGQAACGMAQSRRSFACLGTGGHHLRRDFQPYSTSRWTIFSFLVHLALMAPQHAQTLSMDLPTLSVFFPARTSDIASESQSLRGRPDVLFLQLETKCLLETHYSMHAHASPPPGGASDYPACGQDCVTEKVVTHPAPCLSEASRSRAVSFVLCVSFGKK